MVSYQLDILEFLKMTIDTFNCNTNEFFLITDSKVTTKTNRENYDECFFNNLGESASEGRLEYLLEHEPKMIKFKFLQAQIEPCFIFDTLNTIAIIALSESAFRTADLIYDLSDLLRLSLKNREFICTLEEEFSHIESYLNIQNARLMGLIDIDINLDPEIKNFMIPALTVFPLVDGIKNIDKKTLVKVEGKKKGKFATITVVILVDSTNEQQSLSNLKSKSIYSIKFKDIQERLKLFFETDIIFKIESQSDGIRIYLELPLKGDVTDVEDFDYRR